jgi:hypothetical protein
MVWGGICASSKTPLVFINKGVKINKENYQSKFWKLWYFPGLSSTSATSNGHSSRILLWRTKQKQLRRCAELIFWISSHLRNGHPTHLISILWITAYGRFWRPGPVLSPTKVWSHWRNCCSKSGIECWRRRCDVWPKISRGVWSSVSVQRRPLRKSLNMLYT